MNKFVEGFMKQAQELGMRLSAEKLAQYDQKATDAVIKNPSRVLPATAGIPDYQQLRGSREGAQAPYIPPKPMLNPVKAQQAPVTNAANQLSREANFKAKVKSAPLPNGGY
jgi:hypothetical protein